jgi:hypothetical protein
MTQKLRNLLILGTIFVAVTWTWLIASLSEQLAQEGVRYISRTLFAGAALISCIALSGWFAAGLKQLWKRDERNEYLPQPEGYERVFVPRTRKYQELGGKEHRKKVFLPAYPKPIEIFEDDQLGKEILSRRGENGGKSHGEI